MRTLSLVEKPGGILAFDFDGTMHWHEHTPPVDPKLLEWIERLRLDREMIWGVCTGRSMMHLMEGLSDGVNMLPDFAVTREREIYFPNRFGRFIPDEDWNRKCEKDHKRLFKKMRKELKAIRRYVEETAKGKWVEVEGDLAGVVLPDQKEMNGLLEEVARLCKGSTNLGYERNGIYLRFSHSDYGKGPALQEVAGRLGLDPSSVYAAGDNFNDFSMLTKEVTARPICPGNSMAEVKARVMENGGVVGQSIASTGVAEAFEEIFGSGQLRTW